MGDQQHLSSELQNMRNVRSVGGCLKGVCHLDEDRSVKGGFMLEGDWKAAILFDLFSGITCLGFWRSEPLSGATNSSLGEAEQ